MPSLRELLPGFIIYLKHVLAAKKLCDPRCASIESCAENNDLRDSVLERVPQPLIDEPRPHQHEVRHAGHFAARTRFLIIVCQCLSDRVLAYEPQILRCQQARGQEVRVTNARIGFPRAKGPERRYDDGSPRRLPWSE